MADDDYLIVINAGTREKDFNWVRENARGFNCTVTDLSDNFTQIAIQGPRGVDTLQKLTDADLSKVKFYWFTHGTVAGLKNILIARTGYTAEDGFEIYVPSDPEDQRHGLEQSSGSRQRVRRHSRRTGRAQHAAPGREAAALRP